MLATHSGKVAVIGAGIVGTTTAYSLLKRGYNVTLFERHSYAAMETSRANGGQLSASNAEVWNSWPTVAKGLRWLLAPQAPLLLNPKPSWHKLRWIAEFLASIPSYRENTIATTRLAIHAREHLLRIALDEGIDFDLERRGILHVYRSRSEFEVAAEVSKLLLCGGLERRAVTPDEIRSLEPALHGNFYGGFYTASDLSGDAHKFAVGLANACVRLGANALFGHEVTRVRPSADRVLIHARPIEGAEGGEDRPEEKHAFDFVVVCAGVMSKKISRSLGDRVNVYPVKGYSITVSLQESSDQSAAPWVSLLDDRRKIVASRLGADRFRVAGTAELNGFNRDIRADRIAPLMAWCRETFPGMSMREVMPWAGLRPMMPNMLPVIRQGRCRRVYYNTGHGHLGWTLSAATAEAVAALVADYAS